MTLLMVLVAFTASAHITNAQGGASQESVAVTTTVEVGGSEAMVSPVESEAEVVVETEATAEVAPEAETEEQSWFVKLFKSHSIASAVIILALTIAIGMMLNKIKFGSVSLGVTWVLFVGIVLSHFGMTIDHEICHFIKAIKTVLFAMIAIF